MYYVREQSLNTDTPIYQSLDMNGLLLPTREIAQRVATQGVDDKYFIDWVLSIVDSNRAFLDIGATIGTWTIPLASKVSHVFSFEDNPRLYNTLCANIALRNLDDKVTPFRADIRNQILDSFNVDNVGIIRIKIDGFEKHVLEGMIQTLARNRFPVLLFESTDAKQRREELFDMIESIRYKITPIYGVHDHFIAQFAMMVYWAGHYSKCEIGGPIDRFVREHFPGIHIIASDGIGGGNLPIEFYPNVQRVAALCTRIPKDNLILLPLDDKTFEEGLFNNIDIPSWESRKNVLFWRGGASGNDKPTLRERVVKHLCGIPNTDVKITKWWGWEAGKDLKEEHFGNRCSVLQHLQYKYIPIIDGNCIASNHQWVFGSGAVPILISHPDNDFWFKRYIEPMVHYIPIQYDLSNLNEMIEWLVTHDDEAKQIATNALELSRRIFSPEFQRQHLLSLI